MVKLRLVIIVVLLMLSVIVDSTIYIMSALTDFVFAALVIIVGWPLAKKLFNN